MSLSCAATVRAGWWLHNHEMHGLGLDESLDLQLAGLVRETGAKATSGSEATMQPVQLSTSAGAGLQCASHWS